MAGSGLCVRKETTEEITVSILTCSRDSFLNGKQVQTENERPIRWKKQSRIHGFEDSQHLEKNDLEEEATDKEL